MPTTDGAAATRRITIDDLLRLRWVSDPAVAPDGTAVVFTLTRIESLAPPADGGTAEPPDYVSHLYLVHPGGGEAVPFTQGRQRDHTPRWSPDGRRIAFLSDRPTGTPPPGSRRPRHLWVIPTTGGEARRVTAAEYDPQDPVWAPDGQALAFVGKLPRAEEPRSAVRVITRLRYKMDGEGFWDGRYRQIFVVPADGGEARAVTDGDYDHRDPAWSPDGRWLAFVANRSPDADLTNVTDVWVVPAAGGEPRRLTPSLGPCALPAWSPDGRRIAYVGHDNSHMTATSPQLWVVDVEGGPPRNLTGPLDRYVGHHILTDMRAHPVPGRPVWSPDGRFLFCLIGLGPTCQVAAVSVEDGVVHFLTEGDHEIFQYALDPACRQLVVALSDVVTPGDLWLADLGTVDGAARPARASWRRLTDVNRQVLAGVALSRPERFEYEGADGWRVEGWVLPPVERQPGRRYPTVLQIHGGPHAAYGYGFFHEFQVLAAEGFAVVYTNPRGSQGYGQAFAAATRHDWGGKDYEDIMRGVDAALARFPYLDPERLGVAGGSYGGFMTNWIIGHTDRFKAAVTMRSIANHTSQWGTSDLAYMKGMWEFPGDLWEAPTFYWERSPLAYVDRITTPLLILHAEEDYRCPVGEAEQLFAALKKQGKAVVFVRFPEESHDLTRKGKPHHRLEHLRWVVRWFADHLGREPVPAPVRELAGTPRMEAGSAQG